MLTSSRVRGGDVADDAARHTQLPHTPVTLPSYHPPTPGGDLRDSLFLTHARSGEGELLTPPPPSPASAPPPRRSLSPPSPRLASA